VEIEGVRGRWRSELEREGPRGGIWHGGKEDPRVCGM
jgi:hypothetical protein